MKVEYRVNGVIRAQMTGHENAMERAATKAMRLLAKEAEKRGRAEIAARLGASVARNFFARAKPRLGYSLNTSMRGYLRRRGGYLNIFERGLTISPKGKQFFWVPLSNIPQKIGHQRMTPALYQKFIGKLYSGSKKSRQGHAPLLFGEVPASGVQRSTISLARLKSGNRQGPNRPGRRTRRTVRVPVFVGISFAQMPDRLNVGAIYEQVSQMLPDFYFQQIEIEEARANGG